MSLEKVKLGDHCVKIGSGATPKGGAAVYIDSGISLIRSQNVYNLSFDYQGLTYITEDAARKLSGVTVQGRDVLLNITGDSVARVCMVPDDALPARVNQHVAIIRTDESLLPEYLLYYLASPYMQAYMLNLAVGKGASRNALTKGMIEDFPLVLPSVEEQEKIVKNLSAFDDLIENNQKQIKLLEEAAQRLYKEWFVDLRFPGHETTPIVDGIPKGWKTVCLDDVISKIATGLNPRKNFVLGNGSNYYVTIKNMSNNDVILDDKCDKVDDAAINRINQRSDLQQGDLLFSGIGTIGRVYLIDIPTYNWNISESVFTMRVNEFVSKEFLYLLLLSQEMQLYCDNNAHGAAQRGIRMADLRAYKFSLPTDLLMDEFTNIVNPLIDNAQYCRKRIKKLKEVRDRLLPKLMSGELEV